VQIRKVKKEKGYAGRPASCFDFHIEVLESLGSHDERITLRDSRSKKRLQDRQDKSRQQIEALALGQSLRDDQAHVLRAFRSKQRQEGPRPPLRYPYPVMLRHLIKAWLLAYPDHARSTYEETNKERDLREERGESLLDVLQRVREEAAA
jgi:hypothetical protein